MEDRKCILCNVKLTPLNCFRTPPRSYCKKCDLQRHKEYYQKNKKDIIKRVNEYRIKNKDKINKYHLEWQNKNIDKHKAYQKKWYERKKKEEPEYFVGISRKYKKLQVIYTRLYRKKNRAWNLEQKHKRRVREQNGKGLTKKGILFLLKKQQNKCFYCNIDISNNYTVDHKIPLCRNGLNEISNCVMACLTCNVKKGKKTDKKYIKIMIEMTNLYYKQVAVSLLK